MSVVQPDVALWLSAWLNHGPPPTPSSSCILVLRLALALPTPSHINPSLGRGLRFLGQALCEHQFHPASKGEAVSPQFTDEAQTEGRVHSHA